MKNFFLIFVLFSGFTLAQMPNISEVWLNHGLPYVGSIGPQNAVIKIKINISEQDKKKDQEYFVSGYTLVDNRYANIEGKIIIDKYKDSKKKGSVYGHYEFSEEPNGTHSGTFAGTFVFNFLWDPKTENITKENIVFKGDWKNYDGTLDYKTELKNQ